MSNGWCLYCGALEGRSVAAGGGRYVTECRSCGRVVEERRTEVGELFAERALDAPLCIVTPDFSENESYRAPPIEDDPFENIGFITAFSTWSLERAPLFTTTTTSFSGQLAELERVLSDSLYTNGATSLAGASMSMIDTLRAYFQIVEVSSILGLERDSCDHAIQLFRDCLSTTYLRNRNIEALATAALVQAMREAQEPRTLQEISAAANISQKEIGRHMKVLSDALKLSQPINSNSISVHMPRFCSLLQLSKPTEDLATHIGEVVINKSFCTRRNPISISAAAIYLSCQLEDKRKTQTEICKATGLTEVTLRKVYKELLESLDDLLPPDYTPAVPLEKAFPVTAAALGRVHVARATAADTSVPTTPYNSAVSNNSAGLAADASSGVGGSGANSPVQANVAQVLISGVGATDRSSSVVLCGSTPPSTDEKSGSPMFTAPNPNPDGVTVEEAICKTRIDSSRNVVRDCSDRERDREKDRERDRVDADYGGLNKKVNMVPAAPLMSGFRPSFFPCAQVDPLFFQEMSPGMWPLHLYGPPSAAIRSKEGESVTQGNDSSCKAGLANAPTTSLKPPEQQYISFLPGMPQGLNPSMQLKMLQFMHSRPPDTAERQGTFEREREAERDGDFNVEIKGTGSQNVLVSNANSGATIQAFAAASRSSQVYGGYPPGIWPYVSTRVSGPYGDFPRLVQRQGGDITQGGENHATFSEKNLEGLPHAEALARMTAPGVGAGQVSAMGGQNRMVLSWPSTPLHPLYLPTTMDVGHGPSAGCIGDGVGNGAYGPKRDGDGGVDGYPRISTLDPGTKRSPDDILPLLSMGGSHESQGGSGHPSGAPPRVDNEVTTTHVNNQPSSEHRIAHGQR